MRSSIPSFTLATFVLLVRGNSNDVPSSERTKPFDGMKAPADRPDEGNISYLTSQGAVAGPSMIASTHLPEGSLGQPDERQNVTQMPVFSTEDSVHPALHIFDHWYYPDSENSSENARLDLQHPMEDVSQEPITIFGHTAGDIAKIKVSLELANSILDTLSDIPKLNAFITPLMKILTVFKSIFEFTSVFDLPSTEEIIRDGFATVNRKLSALSLQLESVGEDLETSIEFHSWFSTYIDYKFKIKNGEQKLQQLMSQMEHATGRRHKLKLAKTYIDYYIMHDIEGTMNNLFRLTATDSTPIQPNLFELYSKRHNCNIQGLSQLMSVILSLTMSGLKQMSSYDFLTQESPGQIERTMTLYDHLYHIKQQYENQVCSCYDSAIYRTEKYIRNTLKRNPDYKGIQLTKKIHRKISSLAPWYNWSVVTFTQSEETNCIDMLLRSRDDQLSFFSHNERTVMVMWEDKSRDINECDDIKNMNTLVFFHLCNRCTSEALKSHTNTLSEERCPKFLQSEVLEEMSSCGIHRNNSKRIHFLAGGISNAEHPCQRDTCNGHGSCYFIPYTSRYKCLCNKYFGGTNCEFRYNPADSLRASQIIGRARYSFGNLIGVPDVVDVYLEVINFSEELQTKMVALNDFSNKLTLYGDSFTKAEFVADKYNQLISGKIDEETFSRQIKSHNVNFNQMYWGLKMMISGNGILISDGLVTSLKKSQDSDTVCKAEYGTKMSEFMRNILTLDQEVTEAHLRFLHWKFNSQESSDEQYPQDEMTEISDQAMSRQQGYIQHWEENSCPELIAEYLVEKYCDTSLSYENLTVTLHCQNGMTPSVPSVRCQRENGTLVWSAKPVCEYLWGSWGSWTSCSRTCGRGDRRRTRSKLNGDTDTDTSHCQIQQCCETRNGLFECANRKCVPLSSVCDGKFDCEDGSDESEERGCTYLRDGDTVLLVNGCGGFMFYEDKSAIMTTKCPPWDFDKCLPHLFTVKLASNLNGRGIHFADGVTIHYRTNGLCINCQRKIHIDSCYYSYVYHLDKYCVADKCAQNQGCVTQIFSNPGLGSCGGSESSDCRGELINSSAVVYLRQGDSWIAGSGIGGCLSRSSCSNNKRFPNEECKCEQWGLMKIYPDELENMDAKVRIIRRRTRFKVNGRRSITTERCKNQHCCEQRDGKFECANGECVSLTSMCDGKLDCADGSDESEERDCTYLKDGDTVALVNGCGGYMSRVISSRYGSLETIQTTDCTPWDFHKCPLNLFRVKLATNRTGLGIRSGDEVTIHYRNSGICVNCQWKSRLDTCSNSYVDSFDDYCVATPCAQNADCKTKIFSHYGIGSCDGSVFSDCRGELINSYDVVYLRQGGFWISGSKRGDWVYRDDCAWDRIPPRKECMCEKWGIVKIFPDEQFYIKLEAMRRILFSTLFSKKGQGLKFDPGPFMH